MGGDRERPRDRGVVRARRAHRGDEGGEISFDFGEGFGKEGGEVTAWEPPHRFAYKGPEMGGGQLAYEWLVEARSGGTCVVRLVNSGFGEGDDWDAMYDGTSKGWTLFLDCLRLHMERFAGQRCLPVRVHAMAAGDNAEVWAVAHGRPRPPRRRRAGRRRRQRRGRAAARRRRRALHRLGLRAPGRGARARLRLRRRGARLAGQHDQRLPLPLRPRAGATPSASGRPGRRGSRPATRRRTPLPERPDSKIGPLGGTGPTARMAVSKTAGRGSIPWSPA